MAPERLVLPQLQKKPPIFHKPAAKSTGRAACQMAMTQLLCQVKRKARIRASPAVASPPASRMIRTRHSMGSMAATAQNRLFR